MVAGEVGEQRRGVTGSGDAMEMDAVRARLEDDVLDARVTHPREVALHLRSLTGRADGRLAFTADDDLGGRQQARLLLAVRGAEDAVQDVATRRLAVRAGDAVDGDVVARMPGRRGGEGGERDARVWHDDGRSTLDVTLGDDKARPVRESLRHERHTVDGESGDRDERATRLRGPRIMGDGVDAVDALGHARAQDLLEFCAAHIHPASLTTRGRTPVAPRGER